jgi:serine/threonine protein kinase
VPRELWQVVRRCLAKDPEKRLQSAKDLRNELEEVKQSLESGELSVESSNVSAAAITGEAQREKMPGPHRRVWAMAKALVVLASAIAVWRYSSTVSAPAEDRPPETSFSVLTTQAGIEQHPSLAPDGRWMVYASDATGNMDIYLQGVGAQTPINLTKDSPADDDQPAFSPDGERIAFRSAREWRWSFCDGTNRRAREESHRSRFQPGVVRRMGGSSHSLRSPRRRTRGAGCLRLLRSGTLLSQLARPVE